MNKLHSRNDLISQEASSWVAKIDNGAMSKKDKLGLSEWINRSPAHLSELRIIAKIWGDVDSLIDNAIKDCIETNNVSSGFFISSAFSHRPFITLSYVSSFVLVLFLSMAYIFPAKYGVSDPLQEPKLVLDAVKGGSTVKQLSDGSTVHLNTNSMIEVRYSENERVVNLISGEVLFDVSKDKARPFRVQIKGKFIEALGTRFLIKLTSEMTEVLVTEGTIKYYEMTAGVQKNHDILLHIGQAGRFFKNTSEVTNLSQQEIQNRMAWLNGEMVFSGEPLSFVMSELSRYNDVHISLAPEIRDIKIGGRFDINDIDRILEALQISEGLDIYTSKDGSKYLSKKNSN